jgi:hypothetical protein
MAISNYEVCKNSGPQGLSAEFDTLSHDPAPMGRRPLNQDAYMRGITPCMFMAESRWSSRY